MADASKANHQNPVMTFAAPGGDPWRGHELADAHGRQERGPENPGRNSDITSHEHYRRPRPARVRPRPGDREGGGPERARVPRLAGRAEPLRGHRQRLHVGVPDHPRRRRDFRRAPEHRPQHPACRGRDHRRERPDQPGHPHGLLAPPLRPPGSLLAVRRGHRPHRPRRDPATAAARRRPRPPRPGRDLRRPLHPGSRRRAGRTGLARAQPLAGQHLHPLPRPRHLDVHQRGQRRLDTDLQPQPQR